MDYQRDDNRRASRSYDERERERRERTAAQRQAERERFDQRQRSRYQARQPQQGTWYERSSGQTRGAQSPQRPQSQRPQGQVQRPRRSVPLQHQSYSVGGYAQRPSQPRPPQLQRGYYSAPALEPRDVIIRAAIVAVLLLVFVLRIATFGGCAQSGELDTQISDQQTQLQQVNDSNTQLQAQIDSMQSTIDSYNQLVSSSSSSD